MDFQLLLNATLETLLMSVVSTLIAYLIGLPLGVLLYVTSKKGFHPNKWINIPLGIFINILRSIPCLLLIVILIPFSNLLLGKGNWSGNWYSMILPLVFSSFAFIARLVEQSLMEVDYGVIEAAKSLGASDKDIIFKVLLVEARTSLITGLSVAVVSIIGYTSFAGYIAAGGLIYEAFNLGYYGTNEVSMWICIVVIVVIVQIFQSGGLFIAKKIDRRRIAK